MSKVDEENKAIKRKRRNFIANVNKYYRDVKAIIKAEKEKKEKEGKSDLLIGRDLIIDKKIELLSNYDNLELLVKEFRYSCYSRLWWIVDEMIESEKDKRNKGKNRRPPNSVNKPLNPVNKEEIDLISEDGIMLHETIYNDSQLKTHLAFMKSYGFKEIYYDNNCLETLSELVYMGGTIHKSWSIDGHRKGLIINIEGVKLDKDLEGYIDESIEKLKNS